MDLINIKISNSYNSFAVFDLRASDRNLKSENKDINS